MGRYGRCDCQCPFVPPGGVNKHSPNFDLLHEWNGEVWPPPFAIETETFGGAVIDEYTMTPTKHNATNGAIYTAAKFKLKVNAPAGLWHAWFILWLPDSTVPIIEIIDTESPTGIVRLSVFAAAAHARVRRFNREPQRGPYPLFGTVVEYDGERYYDYAPQMYPHGKNLPGQTEEQIVPFRCWRPVLSVNNGRTIDSTTLEYPSPAIAYECDPSPDKVSRVGLVVGLTTVGETAGENREASGDIRASIDLSNTAAVALYQPDCNCWWEPPISSLTATFESAPVEIEGVTLTLTRQADGTFTGSGTFGPNSLSFSMEYTPCGDLLLTFDGCGITFTLKDGNSSVYRPVNLVLGTQACYDGTFIEVPDCGLTPNSSLPVGSPPFIEIWACLSFSVRLEQ